MGILRYWHCRARGPCNGERSAESTMIYFRTAPPFRAWKDWLRIMDHDTTNTMPPQFEMEGGERELPRRPIYASIDLCYTRATFTRTLQSRENIKACGFHQAAKGMNLYVMDAVAIHFAIERNKVKHRDTVCAGGAKWVIEAEALKWMPWSDPRVFEMECRKEKKCYAWFAEIG